MPFTVELSVGLTGYLNDVRHVSGMKNMEERQGRSWGGGGSGGSSTPLLSSAIVGGAIQHSIILYMH